MGQKSRWTLPQIVHPTKYRRFVICVPDEQFYVAAFQGLLIELTYSKNWQRDAGHTAAVVSRVWQRALETVLCDDCGEVVYLSESDYEMSICEQLRFHNGKLQGLCCGEWVDIDGQTGNPPGGGDQPGDGTEQPPIGGCADYHANMGANNQWYLPTIVSTGDVITVTNMRGAGNDGTVSPWKCPSGDTFFAGLCIGGTGGTSGGDPAVAANHMELVMNVGGTWVRPKLGAYTVPGGVTNAQVYFQVNDSVLYDNAGNYTFDVNVCNNAAETFTHLFNFALTNGGFVNILDAGNTPNISGTWTAGGGWDSTAAATGGGQVEHAVKIKLDFAAPVTLDTAVLTFNLTKGIIDPGLTNGLYIRLVGVNVATHTEAADTAPDGTPRTFSLGPAIGSSDQILIVVYDGWDNPAAPGTTRLLTLEVTGSGADPF